MLSMMEMPSMKALNLKRMSLDELMSLRDHIHTTLANRVKSEQRELESRLARLRKVSEPEIESLGPRKATLKGRKIAPKYCNPDDPSETWAGRGRTPRWMAAALKSGKKMSDFEIGAGASGPSRAGRKQRTRH